MTEVIFAVGHYCAPAIQHVIEVCDTHMREASPRLGWKLNTRVWIQ